MTENIFITLAYVILIIMHKEQKYTTLTDCKLIKNGQNKKIMYIKWYLVFFSGKDNV